MYKKSDQSTTALQGVSEGIGQSEEWYRVLYENNPSMYFIVDKEGTVLSINQTGAAHLGYEASELTGQSLLGILHEADKEAFLTSLAACLQKPGETIHQEFRKIHKDTSMLWTKAVLRAVQHPGGDSVAIVVCEDITQHKLAEHRLDNLSNFDALTGLPNRTLFMDRLSQALVRAPWHARIMAVLFINLDQFKIINDALGREAGDMLLKAVAERLVTYVREGDTVARLGGNEFSLILRDIAQELDVTPIVQKILDGLTQPFSWEGDELFITTSIGISLYPNDGSDPETLLQNAGTAMYHAKKQGRKHFQYYSAAMGATASERLSLESSLRQALERSEFLLHYQPLVDLSSSQIIGVEALLRWKHPEAGMVSPAQFIPLAEESGLIAGIGEWVLYMACAQNKLWQTAGIAPIFMAVNLSACQLPGGNLVALIGNVLRETGLDPKYLELELTESTMQNAEAAKTLHALNETGVGIVIDDFGTGYSSLSYLKRFPIRKLKIDQSFVRHVPDDLNNAAICRAVTIMAHSLKLKVVAEGVETLNELEFLRSLNCNEIQGYFFSKPLPAEQMTELLQQKRCL
ncbi:MAG: EAL domain-containing protein [Gammaproteobacteria bacterium]|nr:EAL domain-containing protein [Gammaproteobacteria bacterium]